MRIILSFLLVLWASAASADEVATPVYEGGDKIAAGYVENVYIMDIKSKLKAKLDTGADTASIGAEIIEVKGNDTFEKDGKIYDNDMGKVIFSVEDKDGNKKILKKKIHRWIQVKSKEGGFIRRPVVFMQFCIAGRLIKDEVNLAERGNFIYPVLVGRNMLSEAGVLVDSAETFLTKPKCDIPQESDPKTDKR